MEIQQTPRQQRIPPQKRHRFLTIIIITTIDPPFHLITPPQTSFILFTSEKISQEMYGTADGSGAVDWRCSGGEEVGCCAAEFGC
jgi:hypothetical protein